MAEKSGFFNSRIVGGVYDRTYNANDYTDNLAVVIGSGVLRSNADDLKPTASGLTVTIAAGRAWINGHYYYNDSPLIFSVPAAPAGGSRYDRIVLRMDKQIAARNVSLQYLTGTASNNPVKPAITRNDNIYDLVIAEVLITANSLSIALTDTRGDADICGWLYSTRGNEDFFRTLDNDFNAWFETARDTLASTTLFKRYTQNITLDAASTAVVFNIPQYNPNTCFIEVYVNGILDNNYAINDSIISFNGRTLTAGTVITVKVYKSIDGTGIMSVADEITELQNAYAALAGVSNFTYKCTGLNDNISLSQIAKAFCEGSYTAAECTTAAQAFLQALGGNTYLASLYPSSQITIDVVGKFGITTAFSGTGTEANPYRWILTSSLTANTDRKIVFDFAKCDGIFLSTGDNTFSTVFYGKQVNIKNVNARVYGTDRNSNVIMFENSNNAADKVNIDNCYLEVNAGNIARIAEHGIFTNCVGYVVSQTGGAYCFKPKSTTFIRLNGGSYYAYGLTSSGVGSAIVHTSASEADAVCMAFNIHCPVAARANYSQGFLSVANAGSTYINGVVSRLTSSGSYNNIVGQINKNKV